MKAKKMQAQVGRTQATWLRANAEMAAAKMLEESTPEVDEQKERDAVMQGAGAAYTSATAAADCCSRCREIERFQFFSISISIARLDIYRSVLWLKKRSAQ